MKMRIFLTVLILIACKTASSLAHILYSPIIGKLNSAQVNNSTADWTAARFASENFDTAMFLMWAIGLVVIAFLWSPSVKTKNQPAQ